MFRWLIFVAMSLLTVITGGAVTWQLNNGENTPADEQMIEHVEKQMDESLMRYFIIKYSVEWQNADKAVVSGRTIFNMPVVTAKIDKVQ